MGKRYGYLAAVLASFLPSPTAYSEGGAAMVFPNSDIVGIRISVPGHSAAIMLTANRPRSMEMVGVKAP